VGQRGHDRVRRAAEHELLHQQPGQEPGGEPALRDGLGHRWGDQDRADRAATRPPVGRAAVHDPDQLHQPVDLLTRLLPERRVARAAAPTHPLTPGNVVDLLAGQQMGVVPTAVPTRTLPLPTAPFLPAVGPTGRVVTVGCLLGRLFGRLLRRRPERQLRQHRHLLPQHADLALQLHDLGPQHGIVRRDALGLSTPELDVAATTGITAAHDLVTRPPPAGRVQHPASPGVSPRSSTPIPATGSPNAYRSTTRCCAWRTSCNNSHRTRPVTARVVVRTCVRRPFPMVGKGRVR